MIVKTKHFGEIDIDESGIYTFQEGLPGFDNVRKFAILRSGEDTPFVWLQCVDQPSLAFAMINPLAIIKDYDIDIKDEILKKIGLQKEEDLSVYSIVVIPEDISKITMNLKAPVLMNAKNNQGIQVILDTDTYSVRHYILDELRRQEVAGDAGTDKKKGTIDHHK